MINTNYDFIHNTGLRKDSSLVHLIDSLNENMEEEISMINILDTMKTSNLLE